MSRGQAAQDEVKMVLVIRGELRLKAGKAAVQVAHAAVMLTLEARKSNSTEFEQWLRQGQKKIALVAETLDDLEELQRRARRQRIPTVFVEDAGLTEVAPGTHTCLGLGPSRTDALDPLTRQLPLL